MTNTLTKGDIVVVKFPFASSLKYKARPAVIISSNDYNENSRDTFIIMAISSQTNNKLPIEKNIEFWNEAGLLKTSIFKSSVATIERDFIIQKLGKQILNGRFKIKSQLGETTNPLTLNCPAGSCPKAFWRQTDLIQSLYKNLNNLSISQEDFITLVDNIIDAKEKIAKYNKHFDSLKAIDKIEIKEEIDKLESLVKESIDEIDRLVYGLYGLSLGEISIVEKL